MARRTSLRILAPKVSHYQYENLPYSEIPTSTLLTPLSPQNTITYAWCEFIDSLVSDRVIHLLVYDTSLNLMSGFMDDHLNQWSILPLSTNTNDRRLLTRHSFNTNGYTVQITDLRNVWFDTLDRQEIIERATREESSIDPSDDITQLQILLQHLEDALCGKQGTTLEMISPILSDGEMILRSMTPLPQGLRPLTWSFNLNRAADEAIRSDLVVPLIAACYLQNQQINQLSHWLVEKDNAIAKIMDKLETSGTDLASIFPTVPVGKNKRGMQRSQIVQHVKGLSPVDKHTWMKAQYSSSLQLVPFEKLVQGAFADNEPEVTTTIIRLANSVNATTSCGQVRNLERSQNDNWLSQQQSNADEFQVSCMTERALRSLRLT